MRTRLITLLLAFALPIPALAQATTDAAKAEGKAFGRELGGTARTAATTPPDATRVPGYGGRPSASGYFDDPDRMAREAASQASANTGYTAIRDSMQRRAQFAPQDLDAAVARSGAINADPLAYTSGMSVSGTQGRCVPLPAGSGTAGRYMATCNTGYTLAQRSDQCRITLKAKATSATTYKYYAALFSYSHYAAPITNFDAALSAGTCRNLGPADTCQTIREYGLTPARDCANFRLDILECNREVSGLDGKAMTIVATGAYWFAQDGATHALSLARDENACAALASNDLCRQDTETCTDSDPVTRIVDGVAVTQPCWAWSRSYTCVTYVAAQDCQTLDTTPGCTLVRNDCLTDEPCRTWERVYDCPLPEQPGAKDQFICDGDVYCIDGTCETIEREANTEFKDAVVALNSMAQARREWDPDTLSLFKGKRETCSSKVFGILNCCKGKGFPLIPGIQLLVALGCNREEMLLHERDAQGLCAYVGTYCSSSFLGLCLTKKKVYCCFESKLTRIIQEQGRAQLSKPWGKPKTEQCLGFTIDEFSRLDLSRMDFSEVYAEFTDAARLPDELQAATHIQQKIEDYYARARP